MRKGQLHGIAAKLAAAVVAAAIVALGMTTAPTALQAQPRAASVGKPAAKPAAKRPAKKNTPAKKASSRKRPAAQGRNAAATAKNRSKPAAAPRVAAVPRPRPVLAAAAASVPPLPQPAAAAAPAAGPPHFGFRRDDDLKAALDAVAADRYGEAIRRAERLPQPIDRRLVAWLVARAPNSGLSAEEIRAVAESHAGWPQADQLRQRAEEAFFRSGPSSQAVLDFFAREQPATIGGRVALAGALRAGGREAEARRLVRDLWRGKGLSRTLAAQLAGKFPDYLDRGDHLYRFRRLVLAGREREALDQAAQLGPGYDKLARAIFAVLDRSDDAPKLLREVAGRFSDDPLYNFGRVRTLRRAGEPVDAARILLHTTRDPEALGDGDKWWDERRDLSRTLLDRGHAELAYRVAAEHSAESPAEFAEAEFHAGWYALRFVGDAPAAKRHFTTLARQAAMPRTSARAYYWLARAFEAEKRPLSARLAYTAAADHGATFYGQLAREKVGLRTTGLERTQRPTALDRKRFAANELAQAARRLAAGGHSERAELFIRALGETLDSPGELTLTATLARRLDQPLTAMAASALADKRGVPVAALPTPFIGVPARVSVPTSVGRALVYAIARQESAFNPAATSHVGARGLMQLMPATAAATARAANLPFSLQRLTSDPHYNATLGAEHLGELLDRLDHSYILTFVGYNAGPGRARSWVKAYGDPRGGAVDPVDWIERIPFDETRDYVQKVMENLQVYRSRLGRPLSLSADLVRNAPRS